LNVFFGCAGPTAAVEQNERFERFLHLRRKTMKSTSPILDHETGEIVVPIYQKGLRERVLEILHKEIDFIPNPEFRGGYGDVDATVSTPLPVSGSTGPAPADLPAHLRRFCETDLLTHEQEVVLFREMNHAKYRANVLRSRLDPDKIDVAAVESITTLLDHAQAIRDHIIKANMRLVMSIVKKFVSPQQSFDDMLSEGVFTLMQAVEKFDFARGFRFSTYAYRSIARTAHRSVTNARKTEARFTRDADDWAFEQPDEQVSSAAAEQMWVKLRNLTSSMLDKLDRRERLIIRSRYALGSHRRVRTFQDLANRLGVSKERVRQLEQRAVSKLQAMATEYDKDELFGATMA